jgi:hypothetical protein
MKPEEVNENYLHKRVRELGGEHRRIKWLGHDKSPDDLVSLPGRFPFLVEVKAPGVKFPHNAHERAQAREHERLRRMGFKVFVVSSFEEIDEVLR